MKDNNQSGSSPTYLDGPEIDDPGEQNQRTQIDYLNEIRQQIGRVRTEGKIRLSHSKWITAYRSTVIEYAEVLAPYLRDESLQSDPPLWDGQKEEYTINPPEIDVDGRLVTESPDPAQIEVNGVQDILAIGDSRPVTFEWTIRDAVRGRQTKTKTVNGAPPPNALRSVVQALDDFRYRNGLGLKLNETVGDAGFEYEDILDEEPGGTAPEIADEGHGGGER